MLVASNLEADDNKNDKYCKIFSCITHTILISLQKGSTWKSKDVVDFDKPATDEDGACAAHFKGASY